MVPRWWRILRGGRWAQVTGFMFGKRWVRVTDECVERVDEDWRLRVLHGYFFMTYWVDNNFKSPSYGASMFEASTPLFFLGLYLSCRDERSYSYSSRAVLGLIPASCKVLAYKHWWTLGPFNRWSSAR